MNQQHQLLLDELIALTTDAVHQFLTHQEKELARRGTAITDLSKKARQQTYHQQSESRLLIYDQLEEVSLRQLAAAFQCDE